MKGALLYRQGSDVPEHSIDELAELAHSLGFSGVSPKASDGDQWQADFDSDPVLSIASARDLSRHQDAYAAHGLGFEPWVVPRGRNPSAEADLHGLIARTVGTLQIDYERGVGFWDSGASHAAFLGYLAAVREAAPTAQLHVVYDFREVARGEWADSALDPYVTTKVPMLYWTDFQQEALTTLAHWANAVGGTGRYRPMLPGNASRESVLLALSVCDALWHPDWVYVFQRVGLRAESWGILRSLSTI